MTRLVIFLVAASGAACVIGARDVHVPKNDAKSYVIVGSGALPDAMNKIARHPWISLKRPGESWERWEVMCCSKSPPLGTVRRHGVLPDSDHGAGGGDVRYHAFVEGVEAEEIIECVRREGPKYPHRFSYRVWPGPNSNTFVDYLIRECDIGSDLPASSVGKDYRGVLGVSGTAGGTGVQVETPVVGLKLGLKEGVEVHLFGLAIGIDLWPPAIIVPFGPGRIGFADR